MVVLNIETSDCTPQTIVIGRRGTYDTTQIAFDLTYLVESYGSGVAVIAVKRSQDESAYPAVATQDGNTLTWTVSKTDTAYVGAGVCQLMWYVNDGLAKTIIYPMVVMKDILQTAEEPPDGYENWVESLTALGAETLQNARDAAQSASEAEDAKDDAVTAKEAAETAANRAESAAGNAGTYASSAANSAGVASQKAIDAALSADSASSSASSASGSAGRASASASSASESATSASNSASSASTSAQTAIIKANEASSSASSASGSAQTASEKAGQAATSATSASNSAGQAANSATAAGQSATNAAGSATTATTQAGIATTTAGEAAQSATAASEAQTAAETAQGKAEDAQEAAEAAQQAAEQAAQDVINKAPVIINSASGEIASFNDGADSMPIRSLVASIEPVQDLHGYDNPWPAGGGKNKLQVTATTQTINGVTFTVNDDGTVLVNGTATEVCAFTVGNASFLTGTKSETYILNGCPANGSSSTYNIDVAGADGYDSGNGVLLRYSPTISNTVVRIRITGGVTISNLVFKPMIRLASVTDATFSPYANICPITGWTGAEIYHEPEYDADANPTISVTFPSEAGIVYGGTLDVVSGKMVVNKVIQNLSTVNNFVIGDRSQNVGGGKFFMGYVQTPLVKLNVTAAEELYSFGLTGDAYDVAGNRCLAYQTQNRTYFRLGFADPNFITTLEDFNTWKNQQEHFEIVFPLANPIEYTLTANELTTLYGTNNIWSSTGETEVIYPADTKLYIDGKLAELQATILENIGG